MCGWNTGRPPAWRWRPSWREYGLRLARVALPCPRGPTRWRPWRPTAAVEIERFLRQPEPMVLALGTGRALRAAVEAMTAMAAEQHRSCR